MQSEQVLRQELAPCCLSVLLLQLNEEQTELEIHYHEQHLYHYNEDRYGGLLLLEKAQTLA